VPPKGYRKPRAPDAKLLHDLAIVNRKLGRIGLDPILSVADARDMSAEDVRDTLRISDQRFHDVVRATKGYLG
jgi:hypothetical protein